MISLMEALLKPAIRVLLLAAIFVPVAAGEVPGPTEHVFATRGDVGLKVYVFRPEKPSTARSAIVIFHGGGWYLGEPSWGFGAARRFAGLGMVAVSAQYRLSNRENPGVTPIEAMADARAAIRWVRANAGELGIARDRIAAYGWSAGAHLIACAAIWSDPDGEEPVSCVPDAMILASPAVSLHHDEWMKRILGDRAEVADLSPDRHVRQGMPPALLLQGRTDTVTPLSGTRAFHEAMLAAGNSSELIVYDGVGHLWTPSDKPDHGWPDPDPEVRERAYRAAEQFLRARGFVD